ncbi:MAG: hypothetical protein ACREPN_10505 [Rudaea sp.]
MQRFLIIAATLALASFALTSAVARDVQVVQKPLVAQTLDNFMQDSARIRKQMEPGGLYGHIAATDKSRVVMRLADMQKLLQAHANASDLATNDKIALANAQEEINGILSHNDNNRLICQHVNPVGSHIPVTTCRTYAEIMAERERAQHDMEKNLSSPQLKAGG